MERVLVRQNQEIIISARKEEDFIGVETLIKAYAADFAAYNADRTRVNRRAMNESWRRVQEIILELEAAYIELNHDEDTEDEDSDNENDDDD
jgi:hypothetical protein